MAKYKDKKSSGCAMCKPWKHGWEPKHKPKDRARLEQMGMEIKERHQGDEKKDLSFV